MINKNNKLTKEQVIHIAKLANLSLTEEEIIKFQQQLSDILGYIDILNELDTTKVKPTLQVTGLENVDREDVVKPSLTQEESLANTKNKHKGYFKVKAIFE